ncbi:ribonuclease H-like domain-containing protein [Patescibacteria group bacterium]
MFEVIFDCETKKFFDEDSLFNPEKLGVSVVSLYKREIGDNLEENNGEMQSFWEKDFAGMWDIFSKADRIIGFNSLGFDVIALSPYSPVSFKKLPHFDIMQKIKEVEGKRVSLNAIAKATLESQKIDNGQNAVLYWEKGDKQSLNKLKKYCEADVAITRDIYDFVLKNGNLKYIDFWNEVRKVELDFTYKKDNSSRVQHSLF